MVIRVPAELAWPRRVRQARTTAPNHGVVIFVRQQNVAQMAFAEDCDMINAFPPD